MPDVAIKIGPRTYQIRCGEGEQDRIAKLGALVAEKYALLGNERAPQEAENLLFTALFLADDLSETSKRAEKAQRALGEAEARLQATHSQVEQEKSRSGGKKAELRAEIDTLRKAEERAREEIRTLKAEIVALREANEHQHDLFGAPLDEEAVATTLEALAGRAEQAAVAIEKAAQSAELEETSESS
ncbi:MAG: hypothetical protein QNI87_02690 [Erythrobacter sp.]|uniref:cell division protein ZapA n=1 Tax=Erythrobacter sp. TaxID=1042 RepID=UPI00261B918F|nr:cell division protein ZapA [Erythrobacter sp.]MDJ0977419.1 hypothetical protein [Erythrobacter sp.]